MQSNKVEAILELISNDNQEVILTCPLYTKGKRLINGEYFKEPDYLAKLKKIIFNHDEDSPTFKQLISKFVRTNFNVDENIFKFLSFAPNSVYRSIYRFLFKLADDQLVALLASLEEELANLKRISESFKKTKQLQSIELLEQRLMAVEKNIEDLRQTRNNFRSMANYKVEMEKNRQIILRVNELETDIDNHMTELKIIDEAIIGQQNSLYDENNAIILRSLYDEACDLIRDVHKKFNDLVAFHNTMILNKIDFLKHRKGEVERNLRNLKEQYDQILEQKKISTIEFFDSNLMSEYNEIQVKIEELIKIQGEIENSLSIWKENENNIAQVEMRLSELNEKTNQSVIDNNIQLFNQYFTKYSERLYNDDGCVIAYNKQEDNVFPIKLGNIGGVGSGKKKGLISAFDLAYYSFSQQMGIKCPQFIVHDKMETTDKKQLQAIFKIAEEIEAQLIMPILNEKLDFLTEDMRKKHIILELSNNDKFFKVK